MKGKLEQGQYYDFKVIKKVTLEDSGQYWILQDPFGFRQMLDDSYYHNYSIVPGQILNCKVDKINCTGKIFLEPPHPFYTVGKVYDFPVISTSVVENCNIVSVIDKMGEQHTVSFNHRVGGDSVKLRVDRIKKAKLFLSDPQNNDECWFTEGKIYSFYVNDIKEVPGCGECFLLKDNADRIHLLPTENYPHYEIKKHSRVRCNVIKQSADGQTTLEPVNPVYTVGKRYLFPGVDFNFKVSYNGREEYVLTVEDHWGHAIDIVADNELFRSFKKLKLFDCEVDKIKKGKLYLTDPQPVNTH